jgi:hypothetical protein
VRAWLLENAQIIEGGLRAYTAELGAGIDINWPAKHAVPTRTGLKIEVLCSAMRRVGGREIQSELSHLATHWQTIIAELPSCESAVVH